MKTSSKACLKGQFWGSWPNPVPFWSPTLLSSVSALQFHHLTSCLSSIKDKWKVKQMRFIYSDLVFELCGSFTWISSLKLLWESNWNFSNLIGAQALLACSLLTSVSSPNTWHHNFGAAEKLILPEMLTAVLYIQILQKTQSQESYFMQKVKNKTGWHCCITNKKTVVKKRWRLLCTTKNI